MSMKMRAVAASRVSICGAWLAFVWATTHWYDWQRTIDLIFGSDMEEYERVARAAPGITDIPLPSQHAARFVPHYLVGLGADILHVGVRDLYYVCAIVLLLAIAWALDRMIEPLRLRRIEYGLCVGALIANPYLYRFLAICPARLADSVFILGGLVALFGLLRIKAWVLVSGLVVATLGRSEAVFPLVVLAPIGVALSPAWRLRTPRMRMFAAGAALVVPLIVYALVRVADRRFSVADHPDFWGLTIFGTLRSLPGSAHELAVHVGRVFVGIAGVTGLLVGSLVARFRARRGLPFTFWAALAPGIAVIGEAAVLNPGWIQGNEPLLSALGTAFFAVAAAVALDFREWPEWSIPRMPAAVAVAGLVMTSLNHRYSTMSPVEGPGAYAALASAGAVIVAAAVAVGARRVPSARVS